MVISKLVHGIPGKVMTRSWPPDYFLCFFVSWAPALSSRKYITRTSFEAVICMIWENIRGLASIFIAHSCWVHENFKICASWRDGVLDFNPRNFQENVSQSSIRTVESIENVFYGLPDVLNAQPTPNSRGEMLIWSWRQFCDIFVVPQAFIKETNEFLKENLKILPKTTHW